MSYIRSRRRKWVQPIASIPRWKVLQALASHQKPFTLLGVSPFSVWSESERKEIVSRTYRRAGKHCEVCGDFSEDLKLFTHYNVDYKLQEYAFDDLYALCDACYLYINRFLVEDKARLDKIVRRGDALLQPYGVSRLEGFNPSVIYFFSFKGYRYINDYFPYVAQRALERGLRVIHYQKAQYCLPFESYFHG